MWRRKSRVSFAAQDFSHAATFDVFPFVPTGTIQSPQFQQALSLFSSAFQSGQLAPLIREFDLGEEAITAATAGDLDAFTRALQKKEEAKKEKKKDDEPEDMALD